MEGILRLREQLVNITDIHAPEALAEFQSSLALPTSHRKATLSSNDAYQFFLSLSMSSSACTPLNNITLSYADVLHNSVSPPLIISNKPANFICTAPTTDKGDITMVSDGRAVEVAAVGTSRSSPLPMTSQEKHCEKCGLLSNLCNETHCATIHIANTLLQYNGNVLQPPAKIPSISDLSDMVQPCGSCKQTALSCPGHPNPSIHANCRQFIDNCTCNNPAIFMLSPPTPKYINVNPPHCTILDPATSWGVHAQAIVAEEANKENQDPC
jgi:hypothetical protein